MTTTVDQVIRIQTRQQLGGHHHAFVKRGTVTVAFCRHRHRTLETAEQCAFKMLRGVRRSESK